MSGKKTRMSLLLEGKQYLLPIQGFEEKLEFWKSCICHCNCELDNFLSIFLMRLVVSVCCCIMKCVNFWKSENKGTIFSNNRCMTVQSHKQVKDPFKVQGRPMCFNRTEYKMFVNIASDSTLQITFKKISLVKFQYSIKE